jgi:Icc protein
MDHLQDERREMARTLNTAGARTDPSLRITRRIFLHKSLLTAGVAASATTYGWFPLINTIDLAWGQTAFKFAWISDTHLYPRDVNTRSSRRRLER